MVCIVSTKSTVTVKPILSVIKGWSCSHHRWVSPWLPKLTRSPTSLCLTLTPPDDQVSITAVSLWLPKWPDPQCCCVSPWFTLLFLFLLRGYQVKLLPPQQQGHEPGRKSLLSGCRHTVKPIHQIKRVVSSSQSNGNSHSQGNVLHNLNASFCSNEWVTSMFLVLSLSLHRLYVRYVFFLIK